jgi:hypothetical protein
MGGPLSTGRTDCGVYGLVETSTIPQPDSNIIINGRNAFTVACSPLAVALMRGPGTLMAIAGFAASFCVSADSSGTPRGRMR